MTLRLRFTIAAIAVTLVVTAIMIGTWRLHSEAAQTRFVEVSLTAKKVLWQKVVASYLDQMSPFTKTITRDRATLNALRKQNMAVLGEAVRTTHNTLHQQKTIDRLQITDLNGKYLASVPNGFTGTTQKLLVRKAATEGKLQRGVERDDDGRLMAVLAFPLYARGKLKGIAVYEKGLQEILDDFRNSDGSDIVVGSTSGEVEYSAKGNESDVPLRPDAASIGGTVDVIEANDSYRVLITLPIQNFSSETIGVLATSQDQTHTYSTQNTLMFATFLIVSLTLVISAVGIYWYGKRAFKPLDQIVTMMSKIADGDLTTCAAAAGRQKDETSRLTHGMCQMVNHLRTLVGEICSATKQLESASDKITITTERADSASQEEVQQIQQITTAVQEMALTVQDIAQNSEKAAEAAQSADNQTQQGQHLVAQVGGAIDSLADEMDLAVDAVKMLEKESNNIGGILEVIRGVADQTNLLALNAAIEAARAGDQGRGFAVVADEVRTLAQRTQESTTEIHQIIESLQHGTKNIASIMNKGHRLTKASVDHARSAESALVAITEAVDKISELNVEIASAVEEQSMVAKEISSNASVIEQVSEDAGSSVKEAASAGSQLRSVASHLTGLVKHFQL